MISLLYNESRPGNTDALSRLDTNQELYLTFYRLILVVVSHYTADYDTFQWLALALHAAICLHLTKNYEMNIPYYNKRVSVVYGGACIAYIWIIVNCILVKALESKKIGYEGQIIVI